MAAQLLEPLLVQFADRIADVVTSGNVVVGHGSAGEQAFGADDVGDDVGVGPAGQHRRRSELLVGESVDE